VKERTRFIETYLSGLYTLTELAERFVAEKIIEFRRRFPHMGARKIVARLAEFTPTSTGLRRARSGTSSAGRTWSRHANAARRSHIRCACAASPPHRATS
jgi:hypothetical protein